MMETVTMSLAEFLLARIAEDEAALRADLVAREFPNPRRFAAECEARRRIVGMHYAHTHKLQLKLPDNPWQVCAECGNDAPCPTVRALALPYADHPDYREEWRA